MRGAVEEAASTTVCITQCLDLLTLFFFLCVCVCPLWQVRVVEKTNEAGKKILISGGARCNVLPDDVDLPRDYVTESSQSAMRAVFRWVATEGRAATGRARFSQACAQQSTRAARAPTQHACSCSLPPCSTWSLDDAEYWLSDRHQVGIRLALEAGTNKYFPASNSAGGEGVPLLRGVGGGGWIICRMRALPPGREGTQRGEAKLACCDQATPDEQLRMATPTPPTHAVEVRDKLVAACTRHDVRFTFNAGLQALTPLPGGGWRVDLQGGGSVEAPRVVLATGGWCEVGWGGVWVVVVVGGGGGGLHF